MRWKLEYGCFRPVVTAVALAAVFLHMHLFLTAAAGSSSCCITTHLTLRIITTIEVVLPALFLWLYHGEAGSQLHFLYCLTHELNHQFADEKHLNQYASYQRIDVTYLNYDNN